MTLWQILLCAWSCVAGAWWLAALYLLMAGTKQRSSVNALEDPHCAWPTITVFKPLPPLPDERVRQLTSEAIASFISQLRPEDELIVGVDAMAAADWEPCFSRWTLEFPTARIHIIRQPAPLQHANPKIAWLEVLAAGAKGECWVWSDADITAPDGFLRGLGLMLADGRNAVTSVYAVRRVAAARGMLDALFVNIELLPGALLLSRLGFDEFAFGAAIAFHAEYFRARVKWPELGAELADDHELGRMLRPVRLIPLLVSTFAEPSDWRDAWRHYFRWQKTVRWYRPAGFAGLFALLPLWGWLVGVAGTQGGGFFVAGLAMVWMAEIVVGAAACGLVGCSIPPKCWVGLLAWPWARAAAWVLAWLPIPAIWTGRKRAWFGPKEV